MFYEPQQISLSLSDRQILNPLKRIVSLECEIPFYYGNIERFLREIGREHGWLINETKMGDVEVWSQLGRTYHDRQTLEIAYPECRVLDCIHNHFLLWFYVRYLERKMEEFYSSTDLHYKLPLISYPCVLNLKDQPVGGESREFWGHHLNASTYSHRVLKELPEICHQNSPFFKLLATLVIFNSPILTLSNNQPLILLCSKASTVKSISSYNAKDSLMKNPMFAENGKYPHVILHFNFFHFNYLAFNVLLTRFALSCLLTLLEAGDLPLLKNDLFENDPVQILKKIANQGVGIFESEERQNDDFLIIDLAEAHFEVIRRIKRLGFSSQIDPFLRLWEFVIECLTKKDSEALLYILDTPYMLHMEKIFNESEVGGIASNEPAYNLFDVSVNLGTLPRPLDLELYELLKVVETGKTPEDLGLNRRAIEIYKYFLDLFKLRDPFNYWISVFRRPELPKFEDIQGIFAPRHRARVRCMQDLFEKRLIVIDASWGYFTVQSDDCRIFQIRLNDPERELIIYPKSLKPEF
ncbi:MAG: hypothetical protein N2654_05555 [Deltaproteobacteria bacterium]|nr:hypothetical protein [Deltaproteobacteria bacterium]